MSRKTTFMVSTTLRSIGILTLITSILWTTVSIYHAFIKPPDVSIEPELLAPISPTLDEETMQNLQSRRQLASDPTAQEIISKAAEILQVEPQSEIVTPQVPSQIVEEASPSAEPVQELPDSTEPSAL